MPNTTLGRKHLEKRWPLPHFNAGCVKEHRDCSTSRARHDFAFLGFSSVKTGLSACSLLLLKSVTYKCSSCTHAEWDL